MECLHFSLLLFFLSSCLCFEPVTASTLISVVGGLALSVGYAGWQYVKCNYEECCNDKWIMKSFQASPTDLSVKLSRSLYGQHLVQTIVSPAIKGHITKKNPKKALVLSFHGSTGVGKNLVSYLISESLYEKGIKSNFVHLYVSTVSFPHKNRVQEYRDKLQREVREATKLCQRSLFIFDEIDKMPVGVIDAIKPYMDYHEEIAGVDFRKNIFIFLSNAGASGITNVALKFWSEGRDRLEITLKDMERLINKGAFNEEGGLHGTEIIRRNLIDLYVPFLPLEKQHVEQCIIDRLRVKYGKDSVQQMHKQSVQFNDVDIIVNQIEFLPPNVEVFAESGCKRIDQKIDIYFD